MKRAMPFVLSAMFILIIFIFSILVVDTAVGDLNCDNTDELILITRKPFQKYGSKLIILFMRGSNNKKVHVYHMDKLNPLKVQVADVDGDKISELSLSVYKETRLDPNMAERPFLYNWNESGLSPKWLGSRLARPFDNYIFCNMDNSNSEELISIEHCKEGKKIINIYVWKGFGFEGLAESPPFNDISKIKKAGDRKIKAKVKTLDNWKWIYISIKGTDIIIDNEN